MKHWAWIFVFVLSSCAPTAFSVNKAYSKKDFQGCDLIVVPVAKGVITNSVEKPFRDNFKLTEKIDYPQALADTFNFYFLKSLRDSTSMVKIVKLDSIPSDTDGASFDQMVFKGDYEERTLHFKIPKKAALPAEGQSARYALFTKNIFFSVSNSSGPGGGFGMMVGPPGAAMMFAGGPSNSRSIALNFEYILWDYRKNEYVTAGIAGGSASANYSIDRGDWYDIIEHSAVSILKRAHTLKNWNY